jgi:hypothetical protein
VCFVFGSSFVLHDHFNGSPGRFKSETMEFGRVFDRSAKRHWQANAKPSGRILENLRETPRGEGETSHGERSELTMERDGRSRGSRLLKRLSVTNTSFARAGLQNQVEWFFGNPSGIGLGP